MHNLHYNHVFLQFLKVDYLLLSTIIFSLLKVRTIGESIFFNNSLTEYPIVHPYCI